MGATASLRSVLRLLVLHPNLAMQYMHDRRRMRQVFREQARGDGYSARPIGVTVKPVFSCNLRCRMCSFVATGAVESNPRDSLPLEVWQRLVDDVQAWRPYLWVTGGEPTLYPHLVPLLAHAKSRGLLCGLTSNGTTLTRMAEGLVESRLDVLVVSVDGPEDVHNRVRGRGDAFERTVRGLAALREARSKRRTHKPLLVINCSLSCDNYQRAYEMVALAEELGADALNIQHLWMLTNEMVVEHNRRWGHEHSVSCTTGSAKDDMGVDGAAVVDLIRRLRKSKARVPILIHPELDEHEIVVYYADPSAFVRRRAAVCAWVNTDILPNGDVSPCFDLVCGNIRQEPFTRIWNNDAFRRHRQRLTEEGDLPICARCCAYWRRD